MKYSESIIKKLLLPGLLAISIPLAASAEPQFEERAGHDGTPGERSEHHVGHGGEAFHFPPGMELSESQRDSFFSIKQAQEKLFYEQSKIIRQSRMDLRQLVTSDQYDDEKAKAITEKLGKALASITLHKVQERHKMFELLTPEQKTFIKSHPFDRAGGHPRFHPNPEREESGTDIHPQ